MLFSISEKKLAEQNNIRFPYILAQADSMRTSQCSPQEGRRYKPIGSLRSRRWAGFTLYTVFATVLPWRPQKQAPFT